MKIPSLIIGFGLLQVAGEMLVDSVSVNYRASPATSAHYVFSDTKQAKEPSPYVPMEGVLRADELCHNSGGIKWIEGLVPHQGDKTAYVECEDGQKFTF